MSQIDVEKLLAELTPEAPCGENLEYDPAFGEMERTAQEKPEQQFGGTIVAAEEPDWRELKRKALDLATRTKDMRIAVHLARAALVTDGISAFCSCLALLHGYVVRYWASVHPQLDPDDDNDPTLRVNTLVSLCDAETSLRLLRKATLVSSRTVGRFGYYDIELAKGEVAAPAGTPVPQLSVIDAAFMDCDVQELQTTAAAVDRGIEDVRSLELTVTEKVGVAHAASFEPLVNVLRRMGAVLNEQLVRRGVGAQTADGDEAADGESTGGGNGKPQRLTGDITSREDVIAAIDKICAYYERYEPSSPLPLLLKRAKRLATKGFLEIIRDLTPDALNQARAIGGVAEGEEGG